MDRVTRSFTGENISLQSAVGGRRVAFHPAEDERRKRFVVEIKLRARFLPGRSVANRLHSSLYTGNKNTAPLVLSSCG